MDLSKGPLESSHNMALASLEAHDPRERKAVIGLYLIIQPSKSCLLLAMLFLIGYAVKFTQCERGLYKYMNTKLQQSMGPS